MLDLGVKLDLAPSPQMGERRNHKSGAAARAGWRQWMVIVSRENPRMVKAKFSQPVLVLLDASVSCENQWMVSILSII